MTLITRASPKKTCGLGKPPYRSGFRVPEQDTPPQKRLFGRVSGTSRSSMRTQKPPNWLIWDRFQNQSKFLDALATSTVFVHVYITHSLKFKEFPHWEACATGQKHGTLSLGWKGLGFKVSAEELRSACYISGPPSGNPDARAAGAAKRYTLGE